MVWSLSEIKGFSNRGKLPKDEHPHILDLPIKKFRHKRIPTSNDFSMFATFHRFTFQGIFTPAILPFQQDHLKFMPEPLEQLREGWRWVLCPYTVGGCHANLNEIGFRELWALRGRSWIIFQESVDVGTRTLGCTA